MHHKLILAATVLALGLLLLGVLDKTSPSVTAAIVADAEERKAVLPDDWAWYRRHERNSAECRGQSYIATCCADARTTVTCIPPKDDQ